MNGRKILGADIRMEEDRRRGKIKNKKEVDKLS